MASAVKDIDPQLRVLIDADGNIVLEVGPLGGPRFRATLPDVERLRSVLADARTWVGLTERGAHPERLAELQRTHGWWVETG
jgi:hypothetical protein